MYRLMCHGEPDVSASLHCPIPKKSPSIPTVITPDDTPNQSPNMSPTSLTDIQRRTLAEVERLTPRQRNILKSTFAAMDIDAVQNGLKMLIKLFSEFPRYKLIWPQFRAIPDSSLMHAIELRRHASVYMSGLGSIIHSMDDTERLSQQLARIARAHIKWNIHRSHISHMLQPVLEIVEDCNGGKITDETREAWTTLYNVIADLIEIYRSQERGHTIV